MSNYLAIATVTAALSQFLQTAAQEVVPGVSVTMGRPDGTENGASGARINLYLYQVVPNTAWRNADLPTRRPDGALVQRPQVALDLHYLITFYGNETELEPQRLLGSATGALHAQPVLTQDRIQATIDTFVTRENPDHYLAGSDLAEQVETVKFSPLPLNLEELSKLWTVFFQTPYALSTVYQGSVVLIEGNGTPQRALPVRAPRISGGAFRQPIIESVLSQAGKDQPIVVGGTLLIRGHRLRGDVTRMRIGKVEVTPEDVSDGRISLPLPDLLRAGAQGVQVVHPGGVESNVAPFVLRPTVTWVGFDVQDSKGEPLSGVVKVHVTPAVGRTQRVILLLNELSGERPAAYTFAASSRDADAGEISVPVSGVKAGEYLVRVQVDGAESPLSVDADPDSPTFNQYARPKVAITGCLSNCLRITGIRFSIGRGRIRGQVTAEDENDRPVVGATVSATWTLPDGTTQDQTGKTKQDGTLSRRFSVPDGEGVYTLTITNVTKDDYAFDPDCSVLSESITRRWARERG
jgi:hypothetical protein